MINRIVGLCLAVAVSCGACGGDASSQARGGKPKAIFIIVDGIPADVVESVPTPNLDAIAGRNGYTRAWVGGEAGGASESPTVSAVGYMSVITGTWANKHNVYDNDVNDPNYDYWDIFRIAKADDPSLQTAIYSTWTDNRTRLLGDGLAAAGGNKLDYHADGFELDTTRYPHDEHGDYIRLIDDQVTQEAARHLRDAGPDLSWVYLEYTDWIAHEFGDSPEMVEAVRWTDSLLGRIREAVADREAENDEDWLIVVTTDHGRDAVDGREHGEQSERERTTWIVTNSRRLNGRFRDNPPAVDILPSIASHLGLDIPVTVRRSLDGESFIDPR